MPGWDTRGRAALELTTEDRGRSHRTQASPAFSTRLSTVPATQTDRTGWLRKTGNQSTGPCLLTLVETNGHLTIRAKRHHRVCSRDDSRSAQFDWTATHLQHPFRKMKEAAVWQQTRWPPVSWQEVATVGEAHCCHNLRPFAAVVRSDFYRARAMRPRLVNDNVFES